MKDVNEASVESVVIPSPPRKRFRIEIVCDGHDWDEASAELRRMCGHVLEHGKECRLICGNGWVNIIESPDQTREQYNEQIEAYLAANRSG